MFEMGNDSELSGIPHNIDGNSYISIGETIVIEFERLSSAAVDVHVWL
jgi:hypothetical protein